MLLVAFMQVKRPKNIRFSQVPKIARGPHLLTAKQSTLERPHMYFSSLRRAFNSWLAHVVTICTAGQGVVSLWYRPTSLTLCSRLEVEKHQGGVID